MSCCCNINGQHFFSSVSIYSVLTILACLVSVCYLMPSAHCVTHRSALCNPWCLLQQLIPNSARQHNHRFGPRLSRSLLYQQLFTQSDNASLNSLLLLRMATALELIKSTLQVFVSASMFPKAWISSPNNFVILKKL